MCFFNESVSCVQGACKFIRDAVDRAHIPCLFPEKMCLTGIVPHSLGSLSSVFSGNPVLRSEVIVNLHVMRPAAP